MQTAELPNYICPRGGEADRRKAENKNRMFNKDKTLLSETRKGREQIMKFKHKKRRKTGTVVSLCSMTKGGGKFGDR